MGHGGGRRERILKPENTFYQWYSETDEYKATIYANFQGADPNKEEVEINVRKFCFFPEKTGLNYITVRGFEMMYAATSWALPTAMQEGLLGTNWSKGWVIENNVIHDAKCSGISIGKEGSTSQEALEIPTELITTGILGTVRIVEQRYENPDGTAFSLGKDLTGEPRTVQPKAGPVENLHEGKNKIKIWSKRTGECDAC